MKHLLGLVLVGVAVRVLTPYASAFVSHFAHKGG
jgi:hypothetical protein